MILINLSKRLLLIFVVSISSITITSAQSCAEILNGARESFNAGHFYTIPALLKPCLDHGFNRDQKIEAYWLLTRTYLFIDDPISAEESYLKLLRQDYEYDIDEENDPIEIVYLSKKFTTTPIFMLHAKGGVNLSSIDMINNYGVDNTPVSAETYSTSYGFHIGGGGEVNINSKFSFGVEMNFHTRSYAYNNVLFHSDKQSFKERQSGLDFPFFLKYRWELNKLRPYFYGGIGFSYLLRAQATLKLIDRISSGSENLSEVPVTGPELDIKQQRNVYNKFVHAGIGFNYRIGYNYIMVDFRYMAGLSNIVSIQQQYGNKALLYNYAYVDDDKRLNNVAISIGFVKPLYKPRKIKKATAKGFLFKFFKK